MGCRTTGPEPITGERNFYAVKQVTYSSVGPSINVQPFFGRVENVYIAYNSSHFAIYLQKFIKICGSYDEVLIKTKMQFFETQ